jgi:hypothetical protein
MTKTLTPAAKRDLAALRAGKPVQFRVGPLRQLVEAGLVTPEGKLTVCPTCGQSPCTANWDWDSE